MLQETTEGNQFLRGPVLFYVQKCLTPIYKHMHMICVCLYKRKLLYELQWVPFRTSPGLQSQYHILSLSIHIRNEANFTNGGLCVHMSLNNNSINIQCFHHRRQRRAPSLRPERTRGKLLRHNSEENFMEKNLCLIFLSVRPILTPHV